MTTTIIRGRRILLGGSPMQASYIAAATLIITLSCWFFSQTAAAAPAPTSEAIATPAHVSDSSPASTSAPTPVSAPTPAAGTLDVFTAPSLKRTGKPMFPTSEVGTGREGWVVLSAMVDATGRPYAVTVADSTGNPKFERSAQRWMESQTFEPARLRGVAVDGAYWFKLIFKSDYDNGALPGFAKAYRAAHDAIGSGDRARADAALQSMKIQTLYEDALYNLCQFLYFKTWGTGEQQLNALKAAIAHEKRDRYLPRDTFRVALREMFVLQVSTADYAGALETYEKLDNDTKLKPALVKAVGDILKLAADQRAFSVAGEIDRRSTWYIRLLKRRFTVDVLSGKLAEIKVRCDRKYVFFRYQPDLQYTITDGFGKCELELIGDPGTTFKLLQS